MSIKIVSIDDIPKVITETPKDDLKRLYAICTEMQVLCIAEHGVGLTATQVGIPWRFFIASFPPLLKFRYFVDCEYLPVGEDRVYSIEGCLSLRRSNGDFRRFKVSRYNRIQLIGKELLTEDRLKLVDVDELHEGFTATVLQHEIEHSRLVLISDVGEEMHLF